MTTTVLHQGNQAYAGTLPDSGFMGHTLTDDNGTAVSGHETDTERPNTGEDFVALNSKGAAANTVFSQPIQPEPGNAHTPEPPDVINPPDPPHLGRLLTPPDPPVSINLSTPPAPPGSLAPPAPPGDDVLTAWEGHNDKVIIAPHTNKVDALVAAPGSDLQSNEDAFGRLQQLSRQMDFSDTQLMPGETLDIITEGPGRTDLTVDQHTEIVRAFEQHQNSTSFSRSIYFNSSTENNVKQAEAMFDKTPGSADLFNDNESLQRQDQFGSAAHAAAVATGAPFNHLNIVDPFE